MKKNMNNVLNEMAKSKGYYDRFAMFMDYGLCPTVMVPNHKRHEFIPIFLKALKKSTKTKRDR